MINNEFPVWLEEAKDLSSTRSKWDWIKFNIRTCSIAYSKKLKKDRKKQEEELNSKYQFALKCFQENPNDVTRLQLENLKNELEILVCWSTKYQFSSVDRGKKCDTFPPENTMPK